MKKLFFVSIIFLFTIALFADNSPLEIKNHILKKCTDKQIKTITIPEGVRKIENNAFEDCKNLKSVVISDGVETIEYMAFFGCSNLTQITIPRSVKEIEVYIFGECFDLTNIIIDKDNPYFVFKDNVLYSKDMKKIIFCSKNLIGSYEIPNTVEEIEKNAFYNCNKLQEIKLNDKELLEDGYTYGFYKKDLIGEICQNCKNLNNIVVGDNPYYILKDKVLYSNDMKNLIAVLTTKTGKFHVPESVIFIENSAFNNCNLEYIEFANNIKIVNNVFFNCKNLKKVVFPKNLCSSIGIDVNTLEEKKINIDFIGSNNLQSIKCNKALGIKGVPKKCQIIHYDEDINSKDIINSLLIENGVVKNCLDRNKKHIIIPNGVVEIDPLAFSKCKLETIEIPNSVTKIGERAFTDCINLKEIKLPNGIKKIEQDTFACSSLEKIIIPESVEEISPYAFFYCRALREVILPDGLKKIGNKAFCCCYCLKTIKIPNNIEEIHKYAFLGCKNTKFDYNGDIQFDVLTKSQEEEIVKDLNRILKIENGVLNHCTEDNINQLIIPDGVRKIKFDAFEKCKRLTKITIPNSVEEIDDFAFRNCYCLKDIVLEENNPNFTFIDNVLYSKDMKTIIFCTNNKISYTIPDSVEKIYYMSFSTCNKLQKISLNNNNIQNIMTLVLCKNLNEINIENNKHYILKDKVLYSNDMKKIIVCLPNKTGDFIVPDSVEDGEILFLNSQLNYIEFPNNMKDVAFCFNSCEKLQEIVFPQNIEGEKKVFFENCNNITKIFCPKDLKDFLPKNCEIYYY